jgi:tetratricopeptide (TPR) repeat protein
MFRRLGLLDAPDFAPWAGAALLDTGLAEAESLIDQLVDAQMLEAAGRDVAGQPRFRFHDLIRLFARERAAAEEPEGERAAALVRALGGLLAIAEEAHGREYGGAGHTLVHSGASRWRLDPDTVERLVADPLAWLEAERLPIVAAIAQAARAHLTEHCWDLALTALTLFEARSFYDDWRDTSSQALAAARLDRDRRGEAAMLHSLAALHIFQQRFGDAAELVDAAMRQFGGVGEEHGYALALRNAALLDRNAGRFDTALSRYEEAAAILRAVGDRYAEAHVLGGIAQIKLEQGHLDDSERLLNQALAMCRAIGSRRGEAQLLYRLGELFIGQDRLDWAAEAFSEVLRLVRDRGDSIGEAYALHGLGDAQLRQGQLPAAEANLSQAFGIARAVGERFAEARACLALGKLYTTSRRLDRADSHLARAARVFAEIQSSLWQARTLDALGTVQELRGDPATARGTWSRALGLFTAAGAPEAASLAARLDRPPRQLPVWPDATRCGPDLTG